ncbi:plasmid stabilization system protein [Elizabethkingia meningoseptica]|uniref:type II toxin-antitoxin system RelE/ParE family toxin n=1 Tax=Elizabethkingia meningoseptica TaxID=238 RepID=UPI000332CA2D|nr:type II toxin-antitoxin system RelE/ParE family toxin [Elizabethkingia meningoseptica]AQX05805.1 plasmid stabilization system protein [Elizabethkingia meningoseptica]AQX47848.1 plasmid stabilization system protein [Elizabethkingia meningoseptica]EOR29923.1 plasmid stabilization system protein [Elizabethkingia meningoseptica ATCC 13253 = NBRC 12535]KUY23037.1 plasmid stabilization system protein [Elizabethkingia meningoseptica]MDE5487321.1 type II toxin-antitoxin system RelE/ParE family toxi
MNIDYSLIIKPRAQQDIREAMDWYREQREDLPEKLFSKIEDCLEKIEKKPEYFQKRYREIRIVFTKRFPYGIYYTIEENMIFVHAVLHTKQNPDTVEKRLK